MARKEAVEVMNTTRTPEVVAEEQRQTEEAQEVAEERVLSAAERRAEARGERRGRWQRPDPASVADASELVPPEERYPEQRTDDRGRPYSLNDLGERVYQQDPPGWRRGAEGVLELKRGWRLNADGIAERDGETGEG